MIGPAARAVAVLGLLTFGAASPYPPLASVEPLVPIDGPAQPPPSNYTPAPVPDPDLDDPALRHSGRAHTEFSPRLYHPDGTIVQGEGFTPNSTVQGEQQRHYRPAPSFSLSVPLQ